MTSETKCISIVHLTGSNYLRWKFLVPYGFNAGWTVQPVGGNEVVPPQKELEEYPKYVAKINRALTIVYQKKCPCRTYWETFEIL